MCILFWRKKKKDVESNKVTHKSARVKAKNKVKKSSTSINDEVPNVLAGKSEKKVKVLKYHVSQNKDKDSEHFSKWRVRIEGSDKTIKFFDTQKIAIDFAQDLADKSGSTVVIHKLDGSIRKQDYTKK